MSVIIAVPTVHDERAPRVTVEYGRRIYSFVNPQHALMCKLAFGGE